VAQVVLVQPVDERLDPALPDRGLGERSADDDGNPVMAVALELGEQVRRRDRRAPAELDDVDAATGDLDEAVYLGQRQATVEHVRDAALTGLDAALG
jgi:hypothetical protein